MPGHHIHHCTFGKGTFTFSTASAAALWSGEITGQISDGMWENSYPHDHYKFWCGLAVAVDDEDRVDYEDVGPERCVYGLSRLANLKWNDDGTPDENGQVYILRDRMLNKGRMGKATGCFDYGVTHAAEYMPATFEEWIQSKEANSWEYDFVSKYMEKVTLDMAADYYATEYDLTEMKADIKRISNAMKAVGRWGYRSRSVPIITTVQQKRTPDVPLDVEKTVIEADVVAREVEA